jgi:hypothetical protein
MEGAPQKAEIYCMATVKSIPFVPLPGERHLLQLMVTLLHSKPKIWRRLVVPSDMPMADLHACIQISMGWENSHLHHFYREAHDARVYYEPPSEDLFGGYFDELEAQNVDYTPLAVTDLLSGPKAKLHYEYDFGDSWLHEIVVEQLLPTDAVPDAPRCIDGKMACPPEDCGGI